MKKIKIIEFLFVLVTYHFILLTVAFYNFILDNDSLSTQKCNILASDFIYYNT